MILQTNTNHEKTEVIILTSDKIDSWEKNISSKEDYLMMLKGQVYQE